MKALYTLRKGLILLFASVVFSVPVLDSTAGAVSSQCMGDVNNDQKIDIFDALLTLQYALNLIPHDQTNDANYLSCGDVYPLDANTQPKGDGKVDIMDALAVLQRAVNLLNWAQTTVAASNLIGPDGNFIRVTNPTSNLLGATAVIPPTALADNKDITISSPGNPPSFLGTQSPRAVDFGPDGTMFNAPVTITIPYDTESITDDGDLNLFYYDNSDENWHAVPTTNIDTINNYVTGITNHFSLYSVSEQSLWSVKLFKSSKNKLAATAVLTKPLHQIGIPFTTFDCTKENNLANVLYYYPVSSYYYPKVTFKYIARLMKRGMLSDTEKQKKVITYNQTILAAKDHHYRVVVNKNNDPEVWFGSGDLITENYFKWYSGVPALFVFDVEPEPGTQYYVNVDLEVTSDQCITRGVYSYNGLSARTSSFLNQKDYDTDEDGIVNGYDTKTPDVSFPSQLMGLQVAPVSSNSLRLSWDKSTDDVGVIGYRIYRKKGNFSTIAPDSATFLKQVPADPASYPDSGLLASTKYCYRVTAVDTVNESTYAEYCATTPATPDTTSPATPSGLSAATISKNQIDLAWNKVNDIDMKGYKIYRDGSFKYSANTNSYTDNTLAADTNYCYRISSYDTSGNESSQGPQVCSRTDAVPDKTPPSTPQGLTATAYSQEQMNLSWTAATDNVKVLGYKVYRGGGNIETLIGTSTSDTDLNPDTEYCYKVSALDTSYNESGKSSQICARTLPPATYAISGKITYNGSGLAGVSVSAGGASVMTLTDGNYTITGLQNGTYTVTPILSGYAFTPQQVTVSNVNGVQNFAAVQTTYSITGKITLDGAGLNGVAVALTGAASKNATTDPGGNYSFTGLLNGSYTVTPTLPGYSFSPQQITVTNTNVTKDFTATRNTYSLSGSITYNGNGLNDVTVALAGATSRSTTTNTSGNYSFSGLQSGSYTVTSTYNGYSFTPDSQLVTISSANGTQDFTATVNTTSIPVGGTGSFGASAGNFLFAFPSSGLDYVYTITSFGSGDVLKLPLGVSPIVNNSSFSDGVVDVMFISAGGVIITIRLTGIPAAVDVQLIGISSFNTAFGAGTVVYGDTGNVTYTISGKVSYNGAGLGGVSVALSGGATKSITTDASGNYTFTGLQNGSYTVTPLSSGYTFTPQSVNIGNANVTINFSAMSPPNAPTELSATAVSFSQINLTWTDIAGNETGFKIERKTGTGGTFAQVDTTTANVKTYNDTGLTPSTTYYYRVRAFNSAGDSVYSNEANATTNSFNVNVTGDWTGYYTATGSTAPEIFLMTLTQQGNTVAGTIMGTQISGAINGATLTLSFPDDHGGSITITLVVAGNSMTGTATGSDTGTVTATKGFTDSSQVTLNYWPNSTDKWWLNVKLYTTANPSRVYLTGPNIAGQYDLNKCGTTAGMDASLQYWWSANNAACTEGNNNYKLAASPGLPFEVTIHVVTATGDAKITKTITSYTTNSANTTYSTADLNGTWSNHQLIAGDAPAWFGWYYDESTITNGIETSSLGHLSGGGTVQDGTRIVSLSLDGIVAPVGYDLHGVLSKLKNVFVETHTESGGTASIAIGVRKSGTFTTADLAGTWYLHALQSGDGAGSNKWMYGTSVITASGVSTDTGIADSTGATGGTQTKYYAVSSDGVVTSTVPGSNFHAVMSSDKNLIVGTVSGGGSYLLLIWVRTGATFTPADQAGTWRWHAIGAKDGANAWLYGNMSLDASGNMAFATAKTSNNPSPPLISGSGWPAITSNGIFIFPDGGHAVMTPDKEIIVMTGTDNDYFSNAPSLWIGLRR